MNLFILGVVLALLLLICSVTTPTSLINRLMGLEACVDGMQINKYPTVNVTAATLTLNPTTHGGIITTINAAAGCAVTPPAATGTFNWYWLVLPTTITSNSTTIDAKAGQASDVMAGTAIITGTTEHS